MKVWKKGFLRGQIKGLGKFYNENIGLVAGWGKIFRTLDGGNTWAMTDSLEHAWGFDVEFVSATDLKISVNMDVSKLYLTASGRSYAREDIQAVTNTETMGAIKYALKSYLTTFEL